MVSMRFGVVLMTSRQKSEQEGHSLKRLAKSGRIAWAFASSASMQGARMASD